MPSDPDEEEHLRRLAADPSTPPETLRELLQRHPSLAEILAQNPGAPTSMLLGFEYEWVARFLLKNPVFPLCLLEDPMLSRASIQLRWGLAMLPETPLELLVAFAESDDPKLCLLLAHNPALPEDLQRRLATSTSEQTRINLARRGAPEPFHRLLLSDASHQVRYWAGQAAGDCKPCRPWRALLQRAHDLAERSRPRRALSFVEQKELLAGGVWARVLLAGQSVLFSEIRRALELDSAPQVRKVLTRGWASERGPLLGPAPQRSLRHEERCKLRDQAQKEERMSSWGGEPIDVFFDSPWREDYEFFLQEWRRGRRRDRVPCGVRWRRR